MTYFPPRISASTINNISTSGINSNSTCVLFKRAFYANPGADKNE